jgi:hypothetical protein
MGSSQQICQLHWKLTNLAQFLDGFLLAALEAANKFMLYFTKRVCRLLQKQRTKKRLKNWAKCVSYFQWQSAGSESAYKFVGSLQKSRVTRLSCTKLAFWSH